MKRNFVGYQYEQMAKEQFCKLLDSIPFVSDVEGVTNNSINKICDFLVNAHFDDGTNQEFYVEVKSNGEKRHVNLFIDYVIRNKLYNNHYCYVFVAPYISEASAEVLRKEHFSYMDLSGNCYILTRRIIISMGGAFNKFVEKREKKNYLSKASGAASVIMRTMLDNTEKTWQVKTLSDITGKAIGTVSNVKSFLKDRDWIEKKENGFVVKNIREWLFTWAKDYHKKDARTLEFYSIDRLSELEQKIAVWSRTHDDSALLGGFAAAVRYAPVVRYNQLDVYVEEQAVREFIKDMELEPVEFGGNVTVTIPHDETPVMFWREINGYPVTSPVQTVLDLLGGAGRGEEAAEAIIAKEF